MNERRDKHRGEGWLFQQRHSRFWWMGYFVDGTQVRQSTRTTDRGQAERKLQKTLEDVRRGEATPHEHRVTLKDLYEMLRINYQVNRRRSLATMQYPFKHLLDYFGEHTKAVRITSDRLERYVQARQLNGAAAASINLELGLLGRAFHLAIRAKRLGRNRLPFLPKLAADETRVRQGFFTRDEVEGIARHLPEAIADLVRFLFFSAWRVGEVRTLRWRDYDRTEGTIRLRAEHSKTKHPRLLPVEGEIALIIDRRLKARRLDCPYIFHRRGRPIGDFRKLWRSACAALGFEGRIVHDLRRSGVRHLIGAGIDPHTVMAFSGHRTASMLRRYHIINLDDLRQAARRSSAYGQPPAAVAPLRVREGEPT